MFRFRHFLSTRIALLTRNERILVSFASPKRGKGPRKELSPKSSAVSEESSLRPMGRSPTVTWHEWRKKDDVGGSIKWRVSIRLGENAKNKSANVYTYTPVGREIPYNKWYFVLTRYSNSPRAFPERSNFWRWSKLPFSEVNLEIDPKWGIEPIKLLLGNSREATRPSRTFFSLKHYNNGGGWCSIRAEGDKILEFKKGNGREVREYVRIW